MINLEDNPDAANSKHIRIATTSESKSKQFESKMSKSMHDGVEVWCDCCSCEAEPYWVEAMQDFDEKIKD